MKLFKNFNIKTVIEAIKIMEKKSILFVTCIFLFCIVELAGIPLITYGTKGVINGLTAKDYFLFKSSLFLIIIKHLIWSIYSPISSYLCNYASKCAIRELKIKTAYHLIKLPQSYHDSKPKGEVLSVISNDISSLEQIYDWSFFQVIRSALQGIGGILMMALIDLRFAIVVFVLGTMNVYVSSYFSGKLNTKGEKLQKNISENNINVYELLKSIKTIKLLNLSNNKKSEFADKADEEADTRIKISKISSKMKGIITGLNVISYLSILGIGAIFVYYSLSDWGTIIALTGLKTSTDCLFSECGEFMAGMQTNIVGVKRLLATLNEKEEKLLTNGGFNIKEDSVPLSANNISFSYDGKTPVLNKFNMKLENGKLTALIGESGSGKSSFMKLLLGLYEPDEGKIEFNGFEDLTIENIRKKTAYVPQEPMLFSESVFYNIALGKNVTREEVIAACKAASIHEFIQTLPNGYDTVILEDGKNFSGGQKQRIAIARALVKNSPILLLDEITSALDSGSEEKIMETIAGISKYKAVLIITHKPNIGVYADKIYDLAIES